MILTLPQGHNATLRSSSGMEYRVSVTIGGQNFKVTVDTGSSDTWIVLNNVSCTDITTGDPAAPSDYFASLYKPSPTVHMIPDQNFKISYLDGRYANGNMVHENITVAGVDVAQAEIALVDEVFWFGADSEISGLMGLAYPHATSAYPGTDPEDDVRGKAVQYDPIFTTMYQRGLVEPIFSIALDRSNEATDQHAGYLSLGGIPDVSHGPFSASAPIQTISLLSGDTPTFNFYAITVDGYVVNNDKSSPKAKSPKLYSTNMVTIVDTGASLTYVPLPAFRAFLAGFKSPVYAKGGPIYAVDCNAKPPQFGVQINGTIFYMDPSDLVRPSDDGACVLGVTAAFSEDSIILGDTFLHGVVAAFDLRAAVAKFAVRNY